MRSEPGSADRGRSLLPTGALFRVRRGKVSDPMGYGAILAARVTLDHEVPGSSPGTPASLDDMTKHVQAELKSGTTVRTCWLRQGIRRGDRVTLKNSEDPARWWDVTAVGTQARDLEEINRGWDNNI